LLYRACVQIKAVGTANLTSRIEVLRQVEWRSVLPVKHVRAPVGGQPSATASSSETQKRMCILHPTTLALIPLSAIKPEPGTLVVPPRSLNGRRNRQTLNQSGAFSGIPLVHDSPDSKVNHHMRSTYGMATDDAITQPVHRKSTPKISDWPECGTCTTLGPLFLVQRPSLIGQVYLCGVFQRIRVRRLALLHGV
jgi:hypothetical protein